MTILFFHINGIYKHSGGISRVTYELCQLLREKGYTIKLLSLRPINNKTYVYDSEQYFMPNEQLISESNINFLCKFIEDNKIPIVINQSGINYNTIEFWNIIRCKTNVKVITCIHNSSLTPVYNYAYQKEWIWKKENKKILFNFTKSPIIRNLIVRLFIFKNRRKFRKILSYSDKVVVLCDGLADEFIKIVNKRSEKITVVPNFTEYASHANTQHKKNIVLWVGTIDFSVKRIDFMLNVWAKVQNYIPEWQLKVLGDGRELKEAKEYAEKLGLVRYSFEGRVDPLPYYQEAKISCVTSSHEAFSLVILESMTNGVVPIVNNSFPAASMLISDNVNGILVPAFDRQVFTESLIALAKNKEKFETMAKESLIKAKDYSGDRIYSLWERMFNSLCNE